MDLTVPAGAVCAGSVSPPPAPVLGALGRAPSRVQPDSGRSRTSSPVPLPCTRLMGFALRSSIRGCSFASEDGATWQSRFPVVPSQRALAFHRPQGEGLCTVKLIRMFSSAAFGTGGVECLVVALQAPFHAFSVNFCVTYWR